MQHCEVQILQNPISALVDSNTQSQAQSLCAVWLNWALLVHSVQLSCSASSICTNCFETTCRVEARIKWNGITPCEIPTLQQSGVVSRDNCTVVVGPHSRRSQCTDAAAITSEPNPDARAHSTVDKTDYRILAWRSPLYGDRRCSSHLSHRSGQMYEDNHCTASPSPEFTVPQRGRKRLSREATLHAILALEWPELVQIGCCKVQWLPRTANKRILTHFPQTRQSTQHSVP